MKTTEKVNIAGYPFTLEEDAYSELDRYLSEILESLSEDSNAEEIVQEIEERIAELLTEICPNGSVAGRPVILDIRRRIGEPSQFTAGETEPQEEKPRNDKRLYRDIENRVAGGVCSGLGVYFNIDKVFIRLIFILLFIASFCAIGSGPYFLLVLLLYICLWISMPAARSVEEKCRMKGKPINISNFRTGISASSIAKEAGEMKKSPAFKTTGRIISSISGIIMTIGGSACLLSLIFINKTPELIALYAERHSTIWGSHDAYEMMWLDMTTNHVFWWLIIAIAGIFGIWLLYNGIRIAFNLKSPSWKPGFVLFILWIISILVLVTWVLIQVAEALPTLL